MRRFSLGDYGISSVIMEAKKSHGLLSAIGRNKKVNSVIRSKSEGQRVRGANGVSPSHSTKAQEWEWGWSIA